MYSTGSHSVVNPLFFLPSCCNCSPTFGSSIVFHLDFSSHGISVCLFLICCVCVCVGGGGGDGGDLTL